MTKRAKGLLVLLILILDWLALDDITTGNEPNYWGEYLTLVVSGVIFLWWWRKRKG